MNILIAYPIVPGRPRLAWCFVLLFLGLGLNRWACAGDWPQILGPQRNGRADDETLPERFPSGKLTVKFEHALGAGYAGPAIANGQVIVFHRQENQEVLESLDSQSGKPIWRVVFPATYQGGISRDNGPRASH